jgi:SAM-dependent methyltransferase
MVFFAREKLFRLMMRSSIVLVAAVALIAAIHYPRNVDKPLSDGELGEIRNYYAEAYKKAPEEASDSDYETQYIRIATQAAKSNRIAEQVSDFVSRYGLNNGAMLDIGSGRGYLQDVVKNYTGLDISSSVSRFYHKKFVLGSATAMPFSDNSFDGGWSIWVLEHVPNPEQVLLEIRRVMKNNAVIFLHPAWNCKAWASEGYDVRPYSDFGFKGKLIKATIPVRDSLPFLAAIRIPNRVVRRAAAWFGPPRLHYRLLQPNYKKYWEPDSDAVNQIDRQEVMLWFRSRGDECLNCNGIAGSPFMMGPPSLVIKIHK